MKIKQTGKHASLVKRLRKPIGLPPYPDFAVLCDKVDAIGEAVAYIIDKKHAKRKLKKAKQGR